MVRDHTCAIIVAKDSCYPMCCKFILENVKRTILQEVLVALLHQARLVLRLRHPISLQTPTLEASDLLLTLTMVPCQVLSPSLTLATLVLLPWEDTTKDTWEAWDLPPSQG